MPDRPNSRDRQGASGQRRPQDSRNRNSGARPQGGGRQSDRGRNRARTGNEQTNRYREKAQSADFDQENETLSPDGTEMIFGKNAILAFLEDNESGISSEDSEDSDDELESRDDLNVEDSHADSVDEESEESRKHPLETTSAAAPRGQVRKPEIGKIYMVTLDHPDRKVERIKQLAKSQRIPVVICDRRKLDFLVGPGQLHQGIAAQISAAEFWELSDFIEQLKKSSPDSLDGSVVAIVDGIEDPHNLGAIIRVAESAGLKGLLLPARRSAGLTGIVAKTSAGALASLPIIRIHNLVHALQELKEAGFWIAGLDSNQGDLYTKVDLVRPLALVIGSEGTGMSRLVKENCDMLLKIPMLGQTESLNASVAAGIVFYEVVRQLQLKGFVKS